MHNMIFSDCQPEKIFLKSGLVVRIMPSELEGLYEEPSTLEPDNLNFTFIRDPASKVTQDKLD